MNEWRDIESAPRDGTEVLVFDPANTPPVFSAMYIDGWSPSVENRYAPKNEFFGDPDKKPTHWMPMPAPPLTTAPAPATQPATPAK